MTVPNTMQRDAMSRNTPNGLVLPLPSPLMAMLPPALQGYDMQWFIQPVPILAVGTNATKTNGFVTDQSHVYVAFYGSLKIRSQDNQTDRDADPAAFSMADTSTLQYQPAALLTDVACAWGNGKQPAVWPVPLIVPQNSGVNITVVNQSNANTNNYNFAFLGVLIKVPPGLQF